MNSSSQHKRRNHLLVIPAVAVILLFGVLPLLIIAVYSFLQAGVYGGVVWKFSLQAYVNILFEEDIFSGEMQFSPAFLLIYYRSLMFALLTTALCLVIGFPTAYYMATRPPSQRNWWLLLMTIPFWSNLLIRTLSIMFIIRDEGLINSVLMTLGITDAPLVMLYTNFAIVLGLVYGFLPFMILPLYATIEKFDFRLVEAASDLYASRAMILWRVIIPNCVPGIIAGCLLVLIPALGAYVIPLILGGGDKLMIGNLIAQQFGSGRNWPLGSAQSMILMAFVMGALLIYIKNTRAPISHG